jgi:putative CocE/NonD family hydrolase
MTAGTIRSRGAVAALAALVGLTVLPAPAALQPQADDQVIVEKNVEARMRDGVVLRADVYRPKAPGKYPVLLQSTPYSKNPGRGGQGNQRLAAQGWVVIVQDTRGRYTSDGDARPHDHANDGHDTVEWAAQLPYSSGRVGMYGSSYLATTALQAATARPPHLAAIQPSAAYSSRYDDLVFQGGAFYLSDGLSWNLGQAADVRRRVLTPDANRDGATGLTPYQRTLYRQTWLWHMPLKALDALELRRFAPAYFEMLDHPSYDSYWETSDISARYDQFEVPALHIVGWHDVFAKGTTKNFAGLRAKARTEKARKNQRLVVGFWTHSQPGPDDTRVGDVDFGPQAKFDARGLRDRWFSCWLKDKDCATLDGPPVRLFIMGENRWRDEQEWPLARAKSTAYYLSSGGKANTLTGDGRLTLTPPGSDPPDRFVYDPWDPVPTVGAGGYSRLPADQREVEQRPDVLVYTTPPLETATEVTGPISVVLWIASSARDTDFTAKLVDVAPDGTARLLTDGIQRARYRKSTRKPELLAPGTLTELTIDVGVTGNLFKAGHRIRLEVSSSNFPRFDRNPNTGGPFGEGVEVKRADQTIFHDAGRPSRLILPVIPR